MPLWLSKLTDVRIGRTGLLGWVFRWAERLMTILSVVVGACFKAKPETLPPLLATPVTWLQVGWLAPAVLILTPLVVWGRKRTDRRKLVAVRGILDQICKSTFNNERFELEQHRRVTLFQHKYFCWRRWPFFGGFLIPVERSGEATRSTGAIFDAPDDGEKCRGVAGRAWSKRANVYVKRLPDLRRCTDDLAFQEYAEKSFMSPRDLRRRPPQARALFGIPVEVGQRRWGVIVIDTVNEEMKTKAAKQVFNNVASPLESYLKGL